MDCRLKINKNKHRCLELKNLKGSRIGFSWKQGKLKYPGLSPKGDLDKDGVKNKKDCRPFNKKKHYLGQGSEEAGYSEDILASPRLYKAYQIIRYGREMGLPPIETHRELKEKGYSGDEMRSALDLYNQASSGMKVGSYGQW